MLTAVPSHLRRAARRLAAAVHRRLSSWTKPAPLAVAAGLAADAVRSRHELALENALLRQQVVILHRHAKRPRFTALDRGLIVLPAGSVPGRRPSSSSNRRRSSGGIGRASGCSGGGSRRRARSVLGSPPKPSP